MIDSLGMFPRVHVLNYPVYMYAHTLTYTQLAHTFSNTHIHTASRACRTNPWIMGRGEPHSTHTPFGLCICHNWNQTMVPSLTSVIILQVSGRAYFDLLSNGADYSPVGILLIVVGLFIAVIGIIGVIGAIFAGTLFGRITLGLVSYLITSIIIIVC